MNDPLVRLPQGHIRGTVGDGVVRFLSVPYAAPPVCLRRFAPPAPPES